MKPSFRSSLLVLFAMVASAMAADLKQARFTQIVKDVKILEMPSKKQKAAAVNESFRSPDILRTGPASRAELIAEDKTITRVGANSIFSFDAASRTINLEEGSVLFHAPKGKGGGTIRTTSAAASVLGTTIIVVATADGGFKVLTLEGKTKVRLPNGRTVTLQAGEMTFVLPNGKGFAPVVPFRLEAQTQNSRLVNGFETPLPSLNAINANVDRQNRLVFAGELTDTGLLVGETATTESIQVIDANLIQERFENVHEMDFHSPPNPPFNFFDVVITGLILDDSHIAHVYPDHILTANNIEVNTELVDLSNFGHAPHFRLNASGHLKFEDNAIHFTEFKTVTPDTSSTPGTVMELFLLASSYSFPNVFCVQFAGPNGFFIESLGDLYLSSTGDLQFRNPQGPIQVSAGGNLNISGNVLLGGQFVDVTAVNELSLQGTRISLTQSSSSIAMFARTIILENITFPSGSSVFLHSELGQLASNPNTRQTPQPGYVNFVHGVMYGTVEAQNVRPTSGPGVYISTLPQ